MTTTNNNNNSSNTTTTTTTTNRPPLVLWAQRADKLFLTIELEDCKNPDIKIEKDKLYFKGKSDSIQQDADHSEHEVTIEFYKPINVDESKHAVRARNTEFVIIKEEVAWWPRLLKDSTKRHWLKVDFPKWKDEDDSDDESAAAGGAGGGGGGFGGQPEFSDLMQQLGSMSGGAGDMGMGGMAGLGGMGGLGGMAGLGGMGGLGGGPGDEEEFDSESDDDDTEQNPPELEE